MRLLATQCKWLRDLLYLRAHHFQGQVVAFQDHSVVSLCSLTQKHVVEHTVSQYRTIKLRDNTLPLHHSKILGYILNMPLSWTMLHTVALCCLTLPSGKFRCTTQNLHLFTWQTTLVHTLQYDVPCQVPLHNVTYVTYSGSFSSCRQKAVTCGSCSCDD